MRTFTVLVHDGEEGGYWAEVPELPGCITQGETLEEVEANIKEAIVLVLEAIVNDGEQLPPEARRWEVTVPLPKAARRVSPEARKVKIPA